MTNFSMGMDFPAILGDSLQQFSDFFLLKAYRSNFGKRKKNPEFKFEVGFRSKKKVTQESFVLHAKHLTISANNDLREIGQLTFYPTFFGTTPLKSAEPIPPRCHEL